MARTKGRYPLSLDLDIIAKLEQLSAEEYGKGSRIVNQILRDHLDHYIVGKSSGGNDTSNITPEDVKRLIREELSRLQVQPVEKPREESAATEVSPETEDKVMGLLDDFLNMREE